MWVGMGDEDHLEFIGLPQVRRRMASRLRLRLVTVAGVPRTPPAPPGPPVRLDSGRALTAGDSHAPFWRRLSVRMWIWPLAPLL